MEFNFDDEMIEQHPILRTLDKRLDSVVNMAVAAGKEKLAEEHETNSEWEEVEVSTFRAELIEHMSKYPCDYVDVMNFAIMLWYTSQLEEITDVMWLEAHDKFQTLIQHYKELGTEPGVNTDFALRMVLTPMLLRFINGERTRKLYEEMLEAE